MDQKNRAARKSRISERPARSVIRKKPFLHHTREKPNPLRVAGRESPHFFAKGS
jgi:hypothetical protein